MSNHPSPLSLRATAFHEAGHAVACIYENVPLLTVSIAPTKNSDGRVGHHNILHGCEIEGEDKPHHRLRMERLVLIALAGPAAERRFSPKGYRSYGGKGDLQFAFELVSKFVGTREEHNAYFHLLKIRTRDFLHRPGVWDEITALATALLEETTLTPKRTRSIVRAALQRSLESEKDKRMKQAKKPQQEK
jgi:hypothetical protein